MKVRHKVHNDLTAYPISEVGVKHFYKEISKKKRGCRVASKTAVPEHMRITETAVISDLYFSVSAFQLFSEKGLTTIFEFKTFAAIGLFEQAFHFLRSRDQIVHFGYLALRERLPAAERRGPLAKSVEEMPDLIHSEPSALGDVDHL